MFTNHYVAKQASETYFNDCETTLIKFLIRILVKHIIVFIRLLFTKQSYNKQMYNKQLVLSFNNGLHGKKSGFGWHKKLTVLIHLFV